MDRQEQLAWEERCGRSAAAAAIGSGLLLLLVFVLQSQALEGRPETSLEQLLLVDRNASYFIAAGVCQALSYLLLAGVLLYLYRVTRHRREELPALARPLAAVAPVALAVFSLLQVFELLDVASDFAATRPLTPAALSERLPDLPADFREFLNDSGEQRAEDAAEGRETLTVYATAQFAARLGLGFALVLVNLNAMRAGLLSRFMGIMGIIIGALFVLPLQASVPFLQIFWLAALGVLFLGRWPGGRGPAWESGTAVPWPGAAEQRAARMGREEGTRGDGATDSEGAVDLGGGEDPRSHPRKRKRKRRR